MMLAPLICRAENWETVRNSGEYFYGEGQGKTLAEAKENAVVALMEMIVTTVSSSFERVDEEVASGGKSEHRSNVRNCLKTYSQGTLTNLENFSPIRVPGGYVWRFYMKRSELERLYELRTIRARSMMEMGEECLSKMQVGMALQNFYWAYTLLRSLQYPNAVKDDEGRILLDVLSARITEVLSAIEVKYVSRIDERVMLQFTYNRMPIAGLVFHYNDGRSDDCGGEVKNGNGILSMAKGHEAAEFYHVYIDYEYKEEAQGDVEVQSVLDVISRRVFPGAGLVVENTEKASAKPSKAAVKTVTTSTMAATGEAFDMKLNPEGSQVVQKADEYADIMEKVIEAARTRNLSLADRYFTVDGGLPRYRELLKKGAATVVGTPHIEFFKGREGQVVARGLQLALTYTRGRKRTFVEDVVFTFNKDKKIENVNFGLGQVAENDILCKHPKWDNEVKEMLMEFLENYKTAYCMKDSDYIRNILSDDAVIIVGNVAKRVASSAASGKEHPMSVGGQDIIRYNRYTKDEYLRNLKRCFDRNEFINLRFSRNDIQNLEKFADRKLYGIQIGQEYSSTTYSDKGFLFLLVDLTNQDQPQIKIRTWQPNEERWDKLYHAGYFYDN